MKKHLTVITAFAVAFVGSTLSVAPASAATLNRDPNASVSVLKLGALASIRIPSNGTGTATISHGPLVLTAEEAIWSTISNGPGTSLFTGVPLISHLTVTMKNYGLTASDMATSVPNPVGDGTITGIMAFQGGPGRAKIPFLSGQKVVTASISKVGAFSKATTVVTLGDDAEPQNVFAKITITMGPWLTKTLNMTSITTNVVQMPGRVLGEQTGVAFTLDPSSQEEVKTFTTLGGFITTMVGGNLQKQFVVEYGGSVNFPTSATGGTGTITLVSPLRVKTGPELVNSMPGIVRQKYSFVPEPGTLALLVSGMLGMLGVGFARMKK